jgi:hypothetical protein
MSCVLLIRRPQGQTPRFCASTPASAQNDILRLTGQGADVEVGTFEVKKP